MSILIFPDIVNAVSLAFTVAAPFDKVVTTVELSNTTSGTMSLWK